MAMIRRTGSLLAIVATLAAPANGEDYFARLAPSLAYPYSMPHFRRRQRRGSRNCFPIAPRAYTRSSPATTAIRKGECGRKLIRRGDHTS